MQASAVVTWGKKRCLSGEWQWAEQLEYSGEWESTKPKADKSLASFRNGLKSFGGKGERGRR